MPWLGILSWFSHADSVPNSFYVDLGLLGFLEMLLRFCIYADCESNEPLYPYMLRYAIAAGERLSPYVSASCLLMSVVLLFGR